MTKERLFAEFPEISSQEWKDKIIADLKGADFDKKLVWRTEEGFTVQPYYRAEDLQENNIASLREQADQSWKIRQEYLVSTDYIRTNQQLKSDSSKGVQAFGLDLGQVKNISSKDLEQLLDGLDYNEKEFHFHNAANAEELVDVLHSWLKDKGVDKNLLKGSLGIDFLGQMIRTGKNSDQAHKELISVFPDACAALPAMKIISVDAGLFQDGGSSLSQELGFGLSMVNEYLDLLTGSGTDINTACKKIGFSFVTGPDYFLEIAKLRAARILWKSILSAWGADEEIPMHIHTRSASWNMTLYDPYVNMLRSTTESMSAILGGSDSISVLPFDAPFRETGEFSNRIARNTQIVLREEAAFQKVADPAAGSYYIEELTEQIAAQAWKHMQECEAAGGFIESVKSNKIQEQVSGSAARKKSLAASGRMSILGVNKYPNINEMAVAQGVLVQETNISKSEFEAIPAFRISSEFEALRLKTEQLEKRPKVFLFKTGDPAWRTARAMFSGNFFGVAGFEIIDPAGFENIQAGIDQVKKIQPDIVVLCSSDDTYADLGPEVKKALDPSCRLVIAGYPADALEALKAAGIEDFIHVKSGLLEVLKGFV